MSEWFSGSLPVGQLPGADQAIASAAKEGWVAVLLVVIVLATFVTFGVVIHRIMKEATDRETRLSLRLTGLEDFIHTVLLDALHENTKAIQHMNSIILNSRDKESSGK